MIIGGTAAARWRKMTPAKKQRLHDRWNSRAANDPLRMVEELLGQISQGMDASSWGFTIEHSVWHLLHDAEERAMEVSSNTHPYCTGTELAEMLDTIEKLTVHAGWYPIYDLGDDFVGRVASLSEVEALTLQ